MMDPNEDRLTLRWFSYFRVKATRLGPAYERFLLDTLPPGATLIVIDCQERWPATWLGEWHLFQFGGVGGATVAEYFQGGPRVREFLRRYGARRSAWDPPGADMHSPEAEWGFEPGLATDVKRFVGEHGFRVLQLTFGHAGDLSPLIADLYRWWYARLGRPTSWLFAQSFVLLAPRLALQSGAVPYWLTFGDRPSLQCLLRYLATTGTFDEIDLTLMPHGTDSIGLSTAADWNDVLAWPRHRGQLAGVDPQRFPADFGAFVHYRDVLSDRARLPVPEPLTVESLESFVDQAAPRYAVALD